jgi:hypothetical protein
MQNIVSTNSKDSYCLRITKWINFSASESVPYSSKNTGYSLLLLGLIYQRMNHRTKLIKTITDKKYTNTKCLHCLLALAEMKNAWENTRTSI